MPLYYAALEDDSAGADTIGPLVAAMRDYARASRNAPDLELAFRPAAHDAGLLIYQHNVPPEDRVGALAGIALENIWNETGILYHEWDETDHDVCLFHLLGEPVRSGGADEAYAGRVWKYARPERPGGYGSGDGLTARTALSGLQAETIAAGTTVDLLGHLFKSVPGTPNFGLQGDIVIAKTADSAPALAIRIRGDNRLLPAVLHGGARYRTPQLPWALFSGNTYVQGDYARREGSGAWGGTGTAVIVGTDHTKQTAAVNAEAMVTRAADLDACLATEETFRVVGSGFAGDLDCTRVWHRSAAGVFTDYTAAANSAVGSGANDVALGLAVGDKLYVAYNDWFSGNRFDLSVLGSGTFGVAKKYWNGAAEVAFTDVVDETNGFRQSGWVLVNPKADWAEQNVNGVPGRYIIYEITAGSIAQAPRADEIQVKQCAMFVHPAAAVDMTAPGMTMTGTSFGYNVEFASTGTRAGWVDFVGVQFYVCGAFAGLLSPGDAADLPLRLTVRGGRFQHSGSYFQHGAGGDVEFGYHPGDRPVAFDVADRIALMAEAHAALVAEAGRDPAKFMPEKIARRAEFGYQNDFFHPTSTGSAKTGGFPTYVGMIGIFAHNTGTSFKGFDRSGVDDMHFFGIRGPKPAGTVWDYKECYLYKGMSFINFYAISDGSAHPLPGGGAANAIDGVNVHDIVCDTPNGGPISNAGLNGLNLNGNNRSILLDDGGGNKNVNVRGLCFKDLAQLTVGNTSYNDPELLYEDTAIILNWDQPPDIDGVVFLRCGNEMGGSRAGQSEKMYAQTFDGTDHVDVTQNLWGHTTPVTTTIFPAGAPAGTAFLMGSKRLSTRRRTLDIVQAVVGTDLVFAHEELRGGVWTAVSNLADDSAGLTLAGTRTITSDRDAAATAEAVGAIADAIYWTRTRLVSGTVTQACTVNALSGALISSYWKPGGNFYSEGCLGYHYHGREGTFGDSRSTFVMPAMRGIMAPGETLATKKWCRQGTNGGELTLAEAQASGFLNKQFETSDAFEDNDFFQAISLTPGVDFVELP